MADEDPPECRVCRDDTGPLIAPCACTGTIKYCHLECLLQWLSHSTTERLRTKPRCGVCQQPFKLRARPAYVYVYHRLSNISAIRKAVPALCEHVLQEPGPHLHCMCARGLIIFGVLQLCLWQAQLLMLLAYGSLCALLLLDAMLDECVRAHEDCSPRCWLARVPGSALPRALPLYLSLSLSPVSAPRGRLLESAGCWCPRRSCRRSTRRSRPSARFAAAPSASPTSSRNHGASPGSRSVASWASAVRAAASRRPPPLPRAASSRASAT